MILAKFFGLIKDCQDFLTLEQKLMRLMAAEACRQYAKILEAIDAELVKKLKRREKVEILRRDRRTVLTMFGTLTFTTENREEKHIIRWTDIWDLSHISAIPRCSFIQWQRLRQAAYIGQRPRL